MLESSERVVEQWVSVYRLANFTLWHISAVELWQLFEDDLSSMLKGNGVYSVFGNCHISFNKHCPQIIAALIVNQSHCFSAESVDGLVYVLAICQKMPNRCQERKGDKLFHRSNRSTQWGMLLHSKTAASLCV